MYSHPVSVGGGRGGWTPTKFSKRGHLIGPQLLEPQLLKVTKNLVTFKIKDSFKDEKLQYFGGSLKNLTFKGGGGEEVHEKKQYKGGGTA